MSAGRNAQQEVRRMIDGELEPRPAAIRSVT